MPFTVPSMQAIRADLLRDIKNQLPDAHTATDSDYYVRATSIASCAEGLYQHQAWIARQIFPDTADTEYLERHAAVRGLTRRPAVAASGFMHAVGTPGTLIAEGVIGVAANGQRYQTIEDGAIGADGAGIVRARAVDAGSIGNVVDGTSVTLQPVSAGITVASLHAMRGGVDVETDTELLARLLDIIRRPPAGGNRHDYRRWALEVPGVTAAFVYPLRRGLGTVDVAIVSGDGLPSDQTLQAVRDHIDDVRPVTAKNSVVLAPEIVHVDVNVNVAIAGPAFDAAHADITTQLATQFAMLAPGDPWIRSQAEALISNVPGVQDRVIVAPVGNVVATVDADTLHWLRLGNVSVELM